MLQNRVDPFGRIIYSSARGAWMGNRGIIHNEHRQIVRHFKHKAWIICRLEFKGRKRIVMTPGRWTELFFLDEATALASGHRPCFECRREDATRFKQCWIKGNPSYRFTMSTPIVEIDEVIHGERLNSLQQKPTIQLSSSRVPDGTFVEIDKEPFLFNKGNLHQWTAFGYTKSFVIAETVMLTLLTPCSIVNALAAGYEPQIRSVL
jgi:hypothetical protein